MPGQLRLGDNCVTMEGITVSDQQEVSADDDNVFYMCDLRGSGGIGMGRNNVIGQQVVLESRRDPDFNAEEDVVSVQLVIGDNNIFHPKCKIRARGGKIVIGDNNIFEECCELICDSPEVTGLPSGASGFGLASSGMRIGDGNRFCTGCVVRAACVNNDNCIGIRSVVEPGVCINDRVLLAANATLPSPLASYTPQPESSLDGGGTEGGGGDGEGVVRRDSAASTGEGASISGGGGGSSSGSRIRGRECGSRGSSDEPWNQVSLVPVCMVPGSSSSVLRPTELPPRVAEEDRIAPSLMDEEFDNDLLEHRRLLREGHAAIASLAAGGGAR